MVVFSGGIGEHSATMRARILEGLEFLGLHLDAAKNGANEEIITRPNSPATARVIPTDEESEIARSTLEVLAS